MGISWGALAGSFLAPFLLSLIHIYLRDFFETNKVPVYLESRVEEITEDEVIISGKDGQRKALPYDRVIKAIGYRSNPVFTSENVCVIGDAKKVGNLRTVVCGCLLYTSRCV